MKKIIITNVLAFSLIFISQELMAQSTSSGVGVLGHLGLGPADYLGWINNTIPVGADMKRSLCVSLSVP